MALNVELEDFLVESLAPSSSQDVDMFAFSNCCCIWQGKEHFCRQNWPFVVLGSEDLNSAKALFAIVTTKDVDFGVADDGSEGASGGIKTFDRFPFFIEDIVGLASGHTFVLAIVTADDVDLSIEVHAWVFFPGIDHLFFLFEEILHFVAVHVATIGGASSCYEDLASWKGAGWGVVLNLAVVDGR